MTRKERITALVGRDIKDRFVALAEEDGSRSASNLAARFIKDGVERMEREKAYREHADAFLERQRQYEQ